MVQKRGESLPPVSFCCLAYPFERTLHAYPALRPVRVLPQQVPLGQPVSLHCLCRPWRPYSATSSVLPGCPTSPVRSSLAYVLGLPNAASGTLLHGRQGSPGSRVRCFRACTRSLRPRRVSRILRWRYPDIAFRTLPLRRHPGVNSFTAQYSACTYPCQRFDCGITAGAA